LTNIILGKILSISSWRILFNAWPKGIQMEALALLKEVGLEDINLNKRVENLSGGQQQRIGIARALIGDPELILADEPVSSLDPETAKEILKLLKMTAKKKKISILCSLHQVEFAKYFADRIIGMNNGKIIFDKASNKLSKLDLNKIYK
jgi:phosphonate transport system ATP-binding protein